VFGGGFFPGPRRGLRARANLSPPTPGRETGAARIVKGFHAADFSSVHGRGGARSGKKRGRAVNGPGCGSRPKRRTMADRGPHGGRKLARGGGAGPGQRVTGSRDAQQHSRFNVPRRTFRSDPGPRRARSQPSRHGGGYWLARPAERDQTLARVDSPRQSRPAWQAFTAGSGLKEVGSFRQRNSLARRSGSRRAPAFGGYWSPGHPGRCGEDRRSSQPALESARSEDGPTGLGFPQ